MLGSKDLYNSAYGSFVGSNNGYYRFRKRLRIKKLTELIRPTREDRILEIGCNDGALVFHLSHFAGHVCGVDINKEQVRRINNKNIQHMSATDLAFENETFDKVCCFDVIEHVSEVKKVFLEVHRILKSGGEFIISFPFEVIRGQAALFDAIGVYKDASHAKMLHVHKLTPKRIRTMIKDIPLGVIHSGIQFLPYPTFVMIMESSEGRRSVTS
jgi:SAM-dependent methyltransferase